MLYGVFFGKKTFTQKEISVYNTMYANNTVAQDFTDLVEFFADNGIYQTYYLPKYGNNLQWNILVSVEDI